MFGNIFRGIQIQLVGGFHSWMLYRPCAPSDKNKSIKSQTTCTKWKEK